MDDALDRDLAQLAPGVDARAAQSVFDRRRRRRRARRRVVLGGAAVVVVALVGGVTAAMQDDGGGEVVEAVDVDAPTTAVPQAEFEVLDVRDATEPMGTLRGASSAAELVSLWSSIGFEGPPPTVNLTRWVVVATTIPDDACPPELTGFDRTGDVLTPVFVEPPGGCRDPLIPKTFVAALNRSLVSPGFVLHLPASETYGYEEQRIFVDASVPADPDFDVLATDVASEPAHILRSAVDAGELDDLWTAVGFDGEPPDVDLDRWVVLSITITDDGCPDVLLGIDRQGSVLVPVFVDSTAQCSPGADVNRTHVVAIDRETLGPAFSVLIESDEATGVLGQVLEVDLDEAVGEADLDFEVLAPNAPADSEPMGSLRSAVVWDEFAELWSSLDFVGDPPWVDFEQWVVVSITIPAPSCGPELTGFDWAGDVLTPVFVESSFDCLDDRQPMTFVVALDRASVAPGFTLRLPAQAAYGLTEHRRRIEVTEFPTTGPPVCRSITAFAEQLGRIGFTLGSISTSGPTELRDRVDAVFTGVFTGGFDAFQPDPALGAFAYVAFEIEVAELIAGSESELQVGARRLVGLVVSNAVDPDDFESAIVAGAPVVVFADDVPDAPVDLVASYEGFATACPGGPPLGFVGRQGEWAGIDSLDELAGAVRQP